MDITSIVFFIGILMGTLLITYWAARQTTTTNDYYTAGGGLTGFQNGLAISGDFMSAASFLGITGAIALFGFDGVLYSIGFLVSYFILLLVAEPIRNLGKYTIGDVIATRFPSKTMRVFISCSTLLISILYVVAQLIAAGALVTLLFGINYSYAVVSVGILMTIYVTFGGMMATSWVQIVKSLLLTTGTFMICLIILSRVDWNLLLLFEMASKSTPLEESFLNPGNLFNQPLDKLSLLLSLLLGTAGLPHILVRFLTVKDAVTVRKSVISATLIISSFYLMTILLGLGSTVIVGWDSIMIADASGNLTVLLLAHLLGGDFLMTFIAAVAFATILAVVSGLIISASTSFAHDLYKHVIIKGEIPEKDQIRVAKVAACCIGISSIFFALIAQHMNVAVLVALIFSIAASVHFPLIVLCIFWRRFTLFGAIAGMTTALLSSIILVVIGPYVMNVHSGLIPYQAIFPLTNPGIVTIPLSFLAAWIGSFCSSSMVDEQTFEEVMVRAQTGIEPIVVTRD
jgi:cation/acetate symporter